MKQDGARPYTGKGNFDHSTYTTNSKNQQVVSESTWQNRKKYQYPNPYRYLEMLANNTKINIGKRKQ
jgi:hypothetical protein